MVDLGFSFADYLPPVNSLLKFFSCSPQQLCWPIISIIMSEQTYTHLSNQQRSQQNQGNKGMDPNHPFLSSYEQIMKIMNSGEYSTSEQVRDCSLAGEDDCNQCQIMAEMLQLTKLKYDKLQSQNYAGELTISYLKNKNKELIRKLSRKGHTENQSTQCSEPCSNRNQQASSNGLECSSSIELQNWIDTFNPLQLKKILQKEREEKPINYQPSLPKQTSGLLDLKQNRQPTRKKIFKLSQFRQKNKLNDSKPCANRTETSKFQFYRF